MTTSVDLGRARALFDGDLVRVLDRLADRLMSGRDLHAPLRLIDATSSERESLDRLLGRRPSRGRTLSIDPNELEITLVRAGIAPDLVTLVEALRGSLREERRAARSVDDAWTAVGHELRTAAVRIDPALGTWVDELLAVGLLRRLAKTPDRATELGRQALQVLERFPEHGITVAGLAAATLGDSHALDHGQALSALVLRGIEATTGIPRADASAGERRAAWARVGVLLDELSGAVLVLGLRPPGDGLVARTLRAYADAGEPARVTLRAMSRGPVDLRALSATRVFVCENPAVVAATADRLGADAPPLVCTDGQPSGAAQTLLGQIAEVGAHLVFHADLDAGGIRIGNLLVARFGAEPWRMARADYLDAADRGRELGAAPSAASWDATLAPTIIERGRAVHEEQVLDVLLDDLAQATDLGSLGR